MHRLFWVRHGESEANVSHTFANRGPGPGLTERGHRQAAEIAGRLVGHAVAQIHSSPLVRSVETAAAIAGPLGLDVSVDEALREYDVGDLEGQANPTAWAAYAEMERRWLVGREWSARHPGGESYLEVVSRVANFRDRVDATATGPVVIVCHGGLLRLALPQVAVGYSHEDSLLTTIPNCGVMVLEPDGRLAAF